MNELNSGYITQKHKTSELWAKKSSNKSNQGSLF